MPDCRVYELVTPPDTNGRRVGAIRTFGTPGTKELFPTELASPSRDSIVYASYSSPLLEPGEANGIVDVYQAERGSSGWETVRQITPSGAQAVQSIPGGVSADHHYALATVQGSSSSLALGGSTDYLANPDGTFELTGLGSLGKEPFAQGRYISEGGGHVIFSTGNTSPRQSEWCFFAGSKCEVLQLEPDAPPTGTGAVYDRSADGPTRVVSLLPGDKTPAAGEEAFYKGVSKDGTVIAFEIKGTLYARVDNAATLEVAAGEPIYAGLSENGRYLFYVVGGDIHRFDIETSGDDQVNSTGDGEVVNVSADGSHVYFISPSQLDGAKGTAGQPNMYVWSGGLPEYIATVAPSDLERTSGTLVEVPALTNWTEWVTNPPKSLAEPGPGAESSRTTPDGNVLVFESRAQLTAYDNDGHTQIYRYDDADGTLVCVSCNPSLEPALEDARLQELVLTGTPTVIHNVTEDGSRVFFETKEALVEGDIDDVNDIYQWHREEGGEITVDLISSGQSTEYPLLEGGVGDSFPAPNVLLSITPDGRDVVFLAQEALVAGAGGGGTAAIYNARVNGGFPLPPAPSICLEEGCRAVPQAPPIFLTPNSET
ncbi:MAG: hypothetical protein M3335_05680, partial [Actinomycetota bacterium]|nr:hypothetical protein [Actinomycetota bacterium]